MYEHYDETGYNLFLPEEPFNQTSVGNFKEEQNLKKERENFDDILPSAISDRLALNNQLFNEDVRSLKAEVAELKSIKTKNDLFFNASLDEISRQLYLSKNSGTYEKKCFYLKGAKSYCKALFKNLDNNFDTKAQSISVIKDCIIFNDMIDVITYGLDILINILEELRKKTITQDKLEFYVENLNKKGLKLFGSTEKGLSKLKDILPPELKHLLNNL